MNLAITFMFFCSGVSFLSIAKEKHNKEYKITGFLMIIASIISALTYFFHKI
ncbi:MAG: hypothetical protein Q611_LSC00238G0002 [Leuconostoc sp. DORA_2]|jgi:Na+-translocating ferredoxin:NAD+ oxidoreductase RnfE subunit|uniref:Uncharacterized protein n=1 Tax=Leuconostoc citreum TaxID=33964 RepID=A0A5A5TYU3_LEUCI|nr:MAG: hypothetical protein Q611_LSC00238G0002 [Leuconostoc sp. DORA_2]TDG64645.1 hypothetical protein C5L21_000463 [Leuconostoc citreum]GDZ82765.1 hypothetical protein LCIT_00070 [Leuconostoc citreum]GDZ86369.1 hypothetical protein LCTS_15680 [Leuconostoc citreum]